MAKYTWCSFADERGFLGVVILPGHIDAVCAAVKLHAIGLNPGGEMVSYQADTTDSRIPPEVAEAIEANMNRLLSKQELVDKFNVQTFGESQAPVRQRDN